MANEEIAMLLIANSGEARSLVFRAVKAAREGDFEEADALLQKADDSAKEAHKAQTQLLSKEARGEAGEVSMLLVHAQDHLMTSLLAQDLIREIIYLYKANANK